MSQQIDFCILGAGLAGLSLADALREQDIETMVIDKEAVAAGASGTPGGLVNLATGRRATKVWQAEQCYEAITQNLARVQAVTEQPFYQKSGLLRPALLEKMARKMRDRYEHTSWPDGWCQWKSENEIKEMHPGIQCIDGGLWLPIGLSVDVGAYLKAYAHFLRTLGVTILTGKQPEVTPAEQGWQLAFDDSTVYAKNIVYATGGSTTESPYWDWLPLHYIKGQVALFSTGGRPLSFSHSISSLGYMAQTGKPNTFVQGSTYEHNFDHINPDKEGEEYLRQRMRRTLPQLEEEVETVGQWAGVRTSTPNRKPILGRHPEHHGLHVFTGLGSKGLLYSKFLARHYADHLTSGTALIPEIDIARIAE
ncbi:NAD(P)/FAD-dependent oxidoreductase [Fodinibius sediminis]|uniref:Glycine/D-amino acid oxidase n=1 Tax=Fodinibius sediminis TaxID=1214077 RepID=A0A521CVV5_9BACT|nr:FAD-dependent oxidoreductase [Fodinibius sediminis]SMO63558.1 Glycine/D-amino acid oxidase [Fodinibius sediminis]